jgi:hypothetical protein
MPTFEILIGFAQRATWLKELSLGIYVEPTVPDRLRCQSELSLKFSNTLQKLDLYTDNDLYQPVEPHDYLVLAKCLDS